MEEGLIEYWRFLAPFLAAFAAVSALVEIGRRLLLYIFAWFHRIQFADQLVEPIAIRSEDTLDLVKFVREVPTANAVFEGQAFKLKGAVHLTRHLPNGDRVHNGNATLFKYALEKGKTEFFLAFCRHQYIGVENADLYVHSKDTSEGVSLAECELMLMMNQGDVVIMRVPNHFPAALRVQPAALATQVHQSGHFQASYYVQRIREKVVNGWLSAEGEFFRNGGGLTVSHRVYTVPGASGCGLYVRAGIGEYRLAAVHSGGYKDRELNECFMIAILLSMRRRRLGSIDSMKQEETAWFEAWVLKMEELERLQRDIEYQNGLIDDDDIFYPNQDFAAQLSNDDYETSEDENGEGDYGNFAYERSPEISKALMIQRERGLPEWLIQASARALWRAEQKSNETPPPLVISEEVVLAPVDQQELEADVNVPAIQRLYGVPEYIIQASAPVWRKQLELPAWLHSILLKTPPTEVKVSTETEVAQDVSLEEASSEMVSEEKPLPKFPKQKEELMIEEPPVQLKQEELDFRQSPVGSGGPPQKKVPACPPSVNSSEKSRKLKKQVSATDRAGQSKSAKSVTKRGAASTGKAKNQSTRKKSANSRKKASSRRK